MSHFIKYLVVFGKVFDDIAWKTVNLENIGVNRKNSNKKWMRDMRTGWD